MSVITPMEKARLPKASETFGPERVARGLGARGHTWEDYFLAVAAAGELPGFPAPLRRHWQIQRLACFSARPQARLWDHDEAALRALAERWLEVHPRTEAPTLRPALRPRPRVSAGGARSPSPTPSDLLTHVEARPARAPAGPQARAGSNRGRA